MLQEGAGIKRIPVLTVAYLNRKGPLDGFPAACRELYAWVRDQGYQVAGPPIGVYHSNPLDIPPQELLWEAQLPLKPGTPLSEPMNDAPGVKKVPAREVAYTFNTGAFTTVGAVMQALFAWVFANGYRLAGPAEEVYLNDLESTPVAEMETEVRFPVEKRGARRP